MSVEPVNGGGDTVVTIMPTAADKAVSFLKGEPVDTDVAGLRPFVRQGNCAGLFCEMCFGNEPKDDNTVVEQHGLRVLVDSANMNYIGGSTLDFEDGLRGAGFHVNNPNAENGCGCGESFRVQGPIS